MNCPEARLRIGAEPTVMPDALAEHLRGCPSCSAFRREMLALDGNIRRALETPVPMSSQRSRVVHARPVQRLWALAASVLLAFGIGAALWAFLPGASLARDVAAHASGEPASWSSTVRLSQAAVDEVVRELGVSFDAQAHHIAYARACPFRGRTVPHLVVRTGQGPITVLVLRGERLRSPRRFIEDGYSGILLPTPEGSLAVLARGSADVDAAARDVQKAIRSQPATSAAIAPELTHAAEADWLNSKPLTLSQLRGRVVLVEFWTFDCTNCRRTLPWLKAMHERYEQDGLVIVSVHTPEFARERDPANVRAAVRELGIRYAVMLDNDFSYWKAMRNRYWPAFYLIDRSGQIAATEIGELHLGQRRGERFENEVRRVLAVT